MAFIHFFVGKKVRRVWRRSYSWEWECPLKKIQKTFFQSGSSKKIDWKINIKLNSLFAREPPKIPHFCWDLKMGKNNNILFQPTEPTICVQIIL